MSFDPASFRSVLGRFATGVTVITTRDSAGFDHGMTVSAFASLSLEPPLVLICIERSCALHPFLMDTKDFVVNILSVGQESLSRRFAEKIENRFDGVGFSRGITGCAVLNDVLASLECRRTDHYVAGDHTIFTGEVIAAMARAERPLLYYRGGYAQLER
jgi:flavin reductase (DIM6/NTAB) family NADH-FMN oxidoreductase RutF